MSPSKGASLVELWDSESDSENGGPLPLTDYSDLDSDLTDVGGMMREVVATIDNTTNVSGKTINDAWQTAKRIFDKDMHSFTL